LNEVKCPVCEIALILTPARSRKSKNPKQFLMLVCPNDGRHFRGFINDREFVGEVIQKAERIGYVGPVVEGTST
jgi:hypothetical protein